MVAPKPLVGMIADLESARILGRITRDVAYQTFEGSQTKEIWFGPPPEM